MRRLKAQLARRDESNVAAAGIAIGDSTNSVVTTHYAPDTVETQRMVSEQINARYNNIIRGNA